MNDTTMAEAEAGREVAERFAPSAVRPMRAVLDRAAGTFSERPALRFRGQVTTYAGIVARIEEATTVLRRLGAGPGVRIGLMLPSCPAIPVYMFAAFATGATVVPFDPEASDKELASMAQAGGINMLVTCDLSAVLAKALSLARLGGMTCAVVVPFAAMLPMASAAKMRLFSPDSFGRPPLDFPCPIYLERDLLRDKTSEAVAAPEPKEMPRPAILDDTAIVWSAVEGGTIRTALLSQAHLASNLVQILEVLPVLTPGRERIVAALPLWHPLAFTLAVNLAVTAGAELTIVPEMTGKALTDAVRRAQPTVIVAPAPLFGAMTDDPRSGPVHLSSLRFGLVCGGMVPAAVRTQMAVLTPAPLLGTYGLAMAPAVIGMARTEDGGLADSTRPLSGTVITVRDFAELSREVPRGERGELCVSGPQVVGAHEVTPNTGAYFGTQLRTGDLGLIDTQGALFIVDRVEDLIVAAGYLIYPRRIEAALLEHSDVLDVAVIGVGDGQRGHAPKAFVVVRRGVAITERDLRMFLAARISKIEMPADIDFCTALPRTAFGLICKRRLREAEAARRG